MLVEKEYLIKKEELLQEVLKIQRAVARIEKAAVKFRHKRIRSEQLNGLEISLRNSAISILIENGMTRASLESLKRLIERI